MKIATLKELALLPKGTMFSEVDHHNYHPSSKDGRQVVSGFQIIDTVNAETNILVCDPLLVINCLQIEDGKVTGGHTVQYGYNLDEGSADSETMFVVWSFADVTSITERLANIQLEAELKRLENSPLPRFPTSTHIKL